MTPGIVEIPLSMTSVTVLPPGSRVPIHIIILRRNEFSATVDGSFIWSNVALLPEMLIMMMTLTMGSFLTCHQFDDWMYECSRVIIRYEKQRSDVQMVEEGAIHDP